MDLDLMDLDLVDLDLEDLDLVDVDHLAVGILVDMDQDQDVAHLVVEAQETVDHSLRYSAAVVAGLGGENQKPTTMGGEIEDSLHFLTLTHSVSF